MKNKETNRGGGTYVYLRFFILSLTFLMSGAALAYTVPQKIPVQGLLTNASTGILLSGEYVFTFRIYNASTGGTLLWDENQTLTVDGNGLWNALLGNNTPLSLNFSEDTYLEVELNHDANPLPRVQLGTTPYAERTDTAANLSCTDCLGTNEIEDVYLLNTGDNATGDYMFNGSFKVENSIGSTLLFVNSSNGNVGVGTTFPNERLSVDGNVNATGNLTLGERITFSLGEIIDNIVDNWIRITGSLNVTGNLQVIGNITGLGPVEVKGGLDVVNDSGTSRFFVNATSGNVGIGTVVPSGRLDVNGSLRVDNSTGSAILLVNTSTGGVNVSGNLSVGGDITFTGETHGSVLINCPADMVRVGGQGGFCVDKYEASSSGVVVGVDLNGDGDTLDAVIVGIEYVCEDGTADGSGDGSSAADCLGFYKAASAYNQTPYVSVTQAQAKASCLAAEKHLCTDYEWYLAAQGTPDHNAADPADDSEECNIWTNSKPSEATWVAENAAIRTGTAARCVSDHGAFDMVGNVWEWTADTAYWNADWEITSGGTLYYRGREITGDQYVAGVDDYGIPNAWNAGAQTAFNSDYNWDGGTNGAYGCSDIFSGSCGEGRPVSGFFRGGGWGNGADAGVFALYLGRAPSYSSSNLGFRCCK